MDTRTKIPPKLHAEIMNYIGDGLSAEDIRTKLATLHNIHVANKTVYRLLVTLRQQYQQVAQVKLAEAAQKSTTADIDLMNDVIKDLTRRFHKAVDNRSAIALAAELNKWNERRMKLNGYEKEEHVDNSDAKDELIEQMEFAKKETKSTTSNDMNSDVQLDDKKETKCQSTTN